MARRKFRNRRVLITGASSGIGRDIARLLFSKGAKLVLTARRQDRLQELAEEVTRKHKRGDEDIVVLAGDISAPEHRRALIEVAERQLGGLDIVVNNAGIGGFGPFVSSSPDRLRSIFEVNFFAPVELTRLALPLLKTSDDAAIINIGSVLSHFSMPNKSEYCASKFALRAFSDSLRMELRAETIDVLSIHPNTTKSEFFDRLSEEERKAAANPFQMTSHKVAQLAVKAIRQRKSDVVISSSGRFFSRLNFFFPRIFRFFAQRLG